MIKTEMSTNGKNEAEQKKIEVTPIRKQTVVFKVVGTAPYVQHRFSEKAKRQMEKKQKAGSQSKKGEKKESRNFEADCESARYISSEGWSGIPTSQFRAAMITACKLVGFHMSKAKLSLFPLNDGVDSREGTNLIKINGDYEMSIKPERLPNGAMDLRARPMWKKWSATVRVSYDADMFSATDVANLLNRAGIQVGIGEGRPDSRNSYGCGWGTFEIEN